MSPLNQASKLLLKGLRRIPMAINKFLFTFVLLVLACGGSNTFAAEETPTGFKYLFSFGDTGAQLAFNFSRGKVWIRPSPTNNWRVFKTGMIPTYIPLGQPALSEELNIPGYSGGFIEPRNFPSGSWAAIGFPDLTVFVNENGQEFSMALSASLLKSFDILVKRNG